MKKIYLLFILFLSSYLIAQEHTVTYDIGVYSVLGQTCITPVSVGGGTFMTGESFSIPASDFSGTDLEAYQNLYNAVVGTTFELESGALTEDIAIQVNITDLDCGNSGNYLNPSGGAEPIFFFVQVIVIVNGVPQIDDYHFTSGKYAVITIPRSTAMDNFLTSIGITDPNDVSFGYWQGSDWISSGLSSTVTDTNYTLRLEHFSKFGGGKGNIVSVKDDQISNMPSEFSLKQNYPNPFNPTTKLEYSIPKEGFVSLKIYNAIGSEVATLVNETKSSGTFSVDFDASDLSSGIYFYSIKYNNKILTRKMMLIK